MKLGICGPEFRHFCFSCEILQLGKFKGADFKYDNIFFKIQCKNVQIRHFGPEFRHNWFFVKFSN